MKTANQRRNKTRLMAAAMTLLATMIVALSLRGLARADALDAWWLRARFALRERVRTPAPDKDIVLVEIDDRSLAKWKEPLFLWGPHLAAAISHLNQSGARLIALDVSQSTEVVDSYFPGRDAPLLEAISRARDVVLVKEFAPDGSEILSTQLLYAIPDAYQDPQAFVGFAEMSKENNIVAALRPQQVRENGEHDVSFSARIAEHISKREAPKSLLREDETFLVNYRGGSGLLGKHAAFSHYSLYDVAQNAKADARFKNKIVIIGGNYSGSDDTHYIPIAQGVSGARLVAGMEIQANAVRTILDNRPIREPSSVGIAIIAILPALLCIAAWLRFSWVGAALASPGVCALWIFSALLLFVARDWALPIGLPLICCFVAAAAMGGARALGEERERRAVLGLWGRYQDPRLVEHFLDRPDARGGSGQQMQVTVLFADLKSFTKTVQHLSPEDALCALNRYLALMTDVIRDEFGGVIDKYLGDGLMAQWGAPQTWPAPRVTPEQKENHAATAIRACLELQRRAEILRKELGADITFGLRLTLHTGPVVVGWVGAQRIEYTIIGDTVNVCARLQETAKEMNCEFLISQSTFDQSTPEFGRTLRIGQTGEVAIRGRDKPLRVLEITGGESIATGGEL